MRRTHIPAEFEDTLYQIVAHSDNAVVAIVEQCRAAGLIVADENAKIAYIEEE